MDKQFLADAMVDHIVQYKAKKPGIFYRHFKDYPECELYVICEDIIRHTAECIKYGAPLGTAVASYGRKLSLSKGLDLHIGVSEMDFMKLTTQLGAGAIGVLQVIGAVSKTTIRVSRDESRSYITLGGENPMASIMKQVVDSTVSRRSDPNYYERWTGPVQSDGTTLITRMSPKDFPKYSRDQMPMEYALLNALGDTKWIVEPRMLSFAKAVQNDPNHILHTKYVSEGDWKDAMRGMNRTFRWVSSKTEEQILERVDKGMCRSTAKYFAEKRIKGPKKKLMKPYKDVMSAYSKRFDVDEIIAEAERRQFTSLQWRFNKCSRGRNYPIANKLSPQGNDLSKSLMWFERGQPWTPEAIFWTKVDIATNAGYDKLHFADRVKWVDENLDRLLEIAEKPLEADLSEFASEKPWATLRGLFALRDALRAPESTLCHLPVAQDCTTSGLQVMSCLSKDEQLARTTNVLLHESGLMGDAYLKVGSALKQKYIDEGNPLGDIELKYFRALCKRSTMIYVYSAGRLCIQDAVYDDRDTYKHDTFRNMDWSDCEKVGSDLYDIIGETFKGAAEVMELFQKAARIALEQRSGSKVCWTTPSGFKAYQRYSRNDSYNVNIKFGTLKCQVNVMYYTDNPSVKEHVRGISPNCVHSLDSCLLAYTAAYLPLHSFSFIHDSIAVHAGETGKMREAFNKAICEVLGGDTLQSLYTEISGTPLNFEFGDLVITPETIGKYVIN